MSKGKEQSQPAPEPDRPTARETIIEAAENLFAQHGFQKVTVRDITSEAGVNVAALNYYFGSKTALANNIFKKRSAELNRDRFRLLQQAMERHNGNPPAREILAALFEPPLRWLFSKDRRKIAIQVILLARTEGTREMREALHKNVTHLEKFAEALKFACPELPESTIYWRLHFCLGLVHNNRPAEFERLRHLSKGVAGEIGADELLNQMLAFSMAGFEGR